MYSYQLQLPINIKRTDPTYRDTLMNLLSQDLDFHDEDSGYASHNYHSFPAKFPPQLPRKFIHHLTAPNDIVLDPMMGSGTTLLEAILANRIGLGFDIDPLAIHLSKVKATALTKQQVLDLGHKIVLEARNWIKERKKSLSENLEKRWDKKTRRFVNYWFAPETQLELLALIQEIEKIEDVSLKSFFELVFSAIIITKSGGVSMAFDLAHTRPHRVKVVISQSGEIIRGKNKLEHIPESKRRYKVKKLRSPLEEFSKRFKTNCDDLLPESLEQNQAYIAFGNAQNLPLDSNIVDLIVTSPPYASNAIDYMRAHKFSLVWMGHSIEHLGEKRKEYIGGEATSGFDFETLPTYVKKIILDIADVDEKKGKVLHRYYSEMYRALREMFRVLKPGKAAIVVVGVSTMRGIDTQTQTCLAEIGKTVGFDVPLIGVRDLDRNRRMMPAGARPDPTSQIQQRMHEEYVIGFYKPETVKFSQNYK